tara:strand:+ start:1996 stop:3243 length:1248 start_codon:yes stop_codon:yes gene_type:complete
MKLTKRDYLYLEKLLKKFDKNISNEKSYPLLEDGFTEVDIIKGIEVLLSKKITMSNITKNFEYEFGKFIGSKYCLMVNSGSSANLLSAFALINPLKKNKLQKGDEFIIPSLCWSTSLWPFIQAGLKPKFIDVDIDNFCLDDNLINNKYYKNCKAIVNIHILGNCSNIEKIKKYSDNKNIHLIEDTCEALGSKYKSKYLGTFGDFGTFSFYYSHQITSGEGGMVICKNLNDYKIMHSLRAHGWDRGISSNKKNNFNFVNSGFNLRPLDLTAAIGLSQFKRLKNMMRIRKKNRNLIIEKLTKSSSWNNQFTFFKPSKNLKPSWFGFPILINNKYLKFKSKFLNYLNANGIETRPILSGNFLNQPSSKLYKLNKNRLKFNISEQIEKRGFFIGLPTTSLSSEKLAILEKKLLTIEKLK